MLGMLAMGSVLVTSPAEAPAVAVATWDKPSPDKAAAAKTYAAFFLGQGGYMFSWGMPYLAAQARELGVETDVFGYSDVGVAWKKIARKKEEGYKIALVGYSLGNTTITYLQRHIEVDLLLAMAESSLGANHQIKKQNTKRAVLWYGPDFLSNAGVKDGFDETNYIDRSHLWMDVDQRVVTGVLGELKTLVEAGPRGAPTVIAKAGEPKTIRVAQLSDGIPGAGGPVPAPTPRSVSGLRRELPTRT